MLVPPIAVSPSIELFHNVGIFDTPDAELFSFPRQMTMILLCRNLR